jgi:hypothetical protein
MALDGAKKRREQDGTLLGRIGKCKQCGGLSALQYGRCERCHQFELNVQKGLATITKHPDLVALDEHLERWYA